MRMTFNRLAYAPLVVCNALDIAAVEAAVARTGLGLGARMLDIGTGNAAVPIRLAQTFGLTALAVEADPVMADLARARIAASGVADRVTLVEGLSGPVLAQEPPFDLIVAIGTVEPAGSGLREPADIFAALAGHLIPGGWLLWGDLTWKGEPPAPLRQMMEIANTYADDAGWRAAAQAAGLEVVSGRMSTDAEWDHYTATMQAAVHDWLAANPDAGEGPAIRRNAERVKLMFDFGRPSLDFSLYLLRKSPSPSGEGG